MNYDFSVFKERAGAVKDWLKRELATLRTGRASPMILDGVKVEAYGSRLPLSQLATILGEGPQILRVSPWDASQLKNIERAILAANLGLSVSADQSGLRVRFPELSTEKRDGLLKLVKKKLEEARVSLRLEREKTWEDIQRWEKDKKISEDEKFRLKNELQKIVDGLNKELEESAERKEKEILR